MKYLLAHTTDDVLGLTGTTLDWPNSIMGFDASNWNDYVESPPHRTNWRIFLGERHPILHARKSVTPFAIYYEHQCNLLLIAKSLFGEFGSWDETLTLTRSGKVVFEGSECEYVFGSLRHTNPFDEKSFSTAHRFFSVDTSAYHIHGTRVQRGQETATDVPSPIAINQVFNDATEFLEARKARYLVELNPSHVALIAREYPLFFATPVKLYLSQPIASSLEVIPNSGLSFPFTPISTELISPN